jgi:hypothetical protein
MKTLRSPLSANEQAAAVEKIMADLRTLNADPAYQRSKAILMMQRHQRAHRDYQIEEENAVVTGAMARGAL